MAGEGKDLYSRQDTAIESVLITIPTQLSEELILGSPNNGKRSGWESIRWYSVAANEELLQAWISIGFQVEWL